MLVCAEIAYWARASQVSPHESVEAVLAWMIRAESKRMCRRSVWFTVEVSSCDGEIVVRMLMSRWNSVVCRGLKVLARTHIVLCGDKVLDLSKVITISHALERLLDDVGCPGIFVGVQGHIARQSPVWMVCQMSGCICV